MAGEIKAGPWLAVCGTCDDTYRRFNPTAVIGYYRTEAEAKAAAARHVEEAGRPLIDTIAEWLAAGPWLP